MGSGTSLVEANMNNLDAVGSDLNPLARLIARVKTTHYDDHKIQQIFTRIFQEIKNYSESRVLDVDFHRISNYGFWYTEERLLKLSYLNQLINEYHDYADFFKIALSEVVREVSFTRNGEFKRYKMSENQIKNFSPDVFGLFVEKVSRNIIGLQQFNKVGRGHQSIICDFNSVYDIPSDIVAPESIDMVITSPPYGDSRTTVAYGQFSRWSNEWFGFQDAKGIDNLLMGGKIHTTESYQTTTIADELEQIKQSDAKRHKEVSSFLSDYHGSIANVAKSVRLGGVVCYVVGNRTVKGIQIPLDYFTAEMFTKYGYKHIDTIVRSIPNKRMPSQTSPTNKTGAKVSTMTNEYIVIMRKVE